MNTITVSLFFCGALPLLLPFAWASVTITYLLDKVIVRKTSPITKSMYTPTVVCVIQRAGFDRIIDGVLSWCPVQLLLLRYCRKPPAYDSALLAFSIHAMPYLLVAHLLVR